MTSPDNLKNDSSDSDQDLTEQARPGHGIPSQDPDPQAQYALEPSESQHEIQSALTAGGMMAGAATGAALGAAMAGPLGVVVGTGLGAVAGALTTVASTLTKEEEKASCDLPRTSDEDVRLHIEDSGGDGRPVVLIHGWPLSAQAWALQVPVLRDAGYRVVTYDRRGFGQSAKPNSDYSYNTLTDDLRRVLDQCGLKNVTLVGFSMGGGEVARYIGRYGQSGLHSVVFAAAVPPCLLHSPDNPLGPWLPEKVHATRQALEQDRNQFFLDFIQLFFSAKGEMKVNAAQREETLAMCQQSAQHAALACMDAFDNTDFREDLKKITIPTLVIHGDSDALVPIEGSGDLTHRAIAHSQMVRVHDAPHGLNVSHAEEFNRALLTFLKI